MDVYCRKNPCMGNCSAYPKGFSLFEVMLTFFCLSLLLGVGIPSFSSLIDRIRLDSDIVSIRSTFSYARLTAVKRNERIIVCHWDGETGCSGSSAVGSFNWVNGLAVFNDPNSNKTLDYSSSEKILKIIPFSKSTSITWSKGEVVAFRSDGSSPGYNGTFSLNSGLHKAKLVLSMAGRLRYDEG